MASINFSVVIVLYLIMGILLAIPLAYDVELHCEDKYWQVVLAYIVLILFAPAVLFFAETERLIKNLLK
jgi:hypothetical protein